MAKTKKTTKTTESVEEVKDVIKKAIVKFNKAFEITYNVTTDTVSIKEV